MENETNTEATVTPTVVEANTADNNTTVATTTEQTTATVEPKVTETTATTETKSAATESKPKVNSELPKGVRKELWELRETVRNLKQELAQSKTTVQTTVNTPATEQVENVNLLDDPEKWAKLNERNVVQKAKQEILAEMEQAKEAERLKRENDEGINYLLSKKEVADDPDAKAELADILQRPEYAYIAQKYPAKAARLAYEEFISSKGVSAERQAVVATNVASTAPVASTAKPMGKKVWSRKEVEATLSKAIDSPDYERIHAEIMQAAKEGRVK